MEESFKRELHGSGLNAAYDGHAKRLLAQKIVLAHILMDVVSGDLGKYDLLSVIIIGLSKELAGETDGTKPHRFLRTLFSSRLSAEEKKSILSLEFKIPMEPELED